MEEIAKYIWSFNKTEELVGEPQSIHNARFIDTLHDDKEQLWKDFVVSLRATQQSSIDTFIDVWKNDTAPMVYKDRALLAIVGTSAVRATLNVGNMAAFGGYFTKSPTSSLQELESPHTQKLSQWYDEAHKYGTEHETKLVDDSTMLTWALFTFEKEEINEEGFNNLLNRINIRRASPKYYEDTDYYLSPNRFPLLDDLFSHKSEKLRNWANTMLDLWIARQSDDSIELPDWLNSITIQQATEYFVEKALPLACASSEEIDKIWPILQKIDLKWLFPSRLHNFQEMLRVTQNQDIRDQLLINLLCLPDERFNTYLIRQNLIDEFKEYVAGSNNKEVARLYNDRLSAIQNIENNIKAKQLEYAATSEEIAKKYAQQAKIREQEKLKFDGLLEKVILASD